MMNDKQSYLEQIDKYYNKKLASHLLIEFGKTPEILQKFGAPDLPLVMQQSTLTKCVRKKTGSRSAHELSREVIETLPKQIENPIFLINDNARNSIALISDTIDRNSNYILIAIGLNETRKEMQVNEIKSIYGKTNLKEYLQKHSELEQLHIIDNKKAEMLSRLVGFQLPQALIASSYNKKISSAEENVNNKDSLLDRLEKNKNKISNASKDRLERYQDHQTSR